MFDYNTINETFTLPSLGKFNNIDPQVVLRSMTGNEEKRRLSNSSEANKVMATIINDCMIDRKFDSYDLCLEDFLYLTYMLRVVTYGPEYPINIFCSHCLEKNAVNIDLDKLDVINWNQIDLESKLDVKLPLTKSSVHLKLITPRQLDLINMHAKEIALKNKDINATYILTLTSRIQTINGQIMPEGLVEKFIQDLPMRDIKVLEKAIRNIRWGLVTDTLTHVCHKCGEAFTFSMPVGRDFFDPEYL